MLHIKKQSSVQRDIVTHLAENGALHISAIAKGTGKASQSVSRAISNLIDNGIIKDIDDDYEYRGRKHPRYWLTEKGIRVTLIIDDDPVNPEKLSKNADKYYAGEVLETMQFVCDVAKNSPQYLKAYNALWDSLENGQVSLNAILALADKKEMMKHRQMLSKYPSLHEKQKKIEKNWLEN